MLKENFIEDLKNKFKHLFNAEQGEACIEDLKNKFKHLFNAEPDETMNAALANIPVILNVDDTPIRNIGYTILFVMIGIFGTWSYVAPIDSSSLATGSGRRDSKQDQRAGW